MGYGQHYLAVLNGNGRAVIKYEYGQFIQLKLDEASGKGDTIIASFVEGYVEDVRKDHIVLTRFSLLKRYYYQSEYTQIDRNLHDYSPGGRLKIPLSQIAAIHRRPSSGKYLIGLDLIGVGMLTAAGVGVNITTAYIGAPLLIAGLVFGLTARDRLLVVHEGRLDHLFHYKVRTGFRLEAREW